MEMGRLPRSPSLSLFFSLFVVVSFLLCTSSAMPRKLAALVKEQPLVLSYHNGPLLKGNLTLHLLWYGRFSLSHRAIISDFLRSLTPPRGSPTPLRPSVASWWSTIEAYGGGGGGATAVSLGRQLLDDGYSLGKSLKSADLVSLASKAGAGAGAINVVLTAEDVAVEGFCMSRCGTHGEGARGASPYIWVGDPATQCPGQCAWPFYRPLYGPQGPPLVAPNGDVGADGMVITLATLAAGTVTNPFGSGFFQGPKEAPLEAVSACTGVFGSGAYPGYPGKVLLDPAGGGSYNAHGVTGRRYLLPAMWDPRTSRCSPLV